MKPIENTSFVLGLISLFGKLSLAEIHILTGFSKSTIQSIIARSCDTYPGTIISHDSSGYSVVKLSSFLDDKYVCEFARNLSISRLSSLVEQADANDFKKTSTLDYFLKVLNEK